MKKRLLSLVLVLVMVLGVLPAGVLADELEDVFAADEVLPEEIELLDDGAKVPAPTVKVDYLGTGADIGLPPDNTTDYAGQASFVVKPAMMSQNGSTLAGWVNVGAPEPRALLKEGDTVLFADLVGVTDALGNTVYTLEPVWVALPPVASHDVSYSRGSVGTLVPAGMDPLSINTEEGRDFNVSFCPYTLEGYDFDGWKDLDGTVYAENEVVTMGTKDLVLIAQWKAVTPPATPVKHTVTFVADGASGVAPSAMIVDEGKSFVVPGAGTLTKDGYELEFWMDEAGVIYYPERTYPVTADLKLTPSWKVAPVTATYYVRYEDGMGGKAFSAYSAIVGADMKTPVFVGGYYDVPTVDYFVFDGWTPAWNANFEIASADAANTITYIATWLPDTDNDGIADKYEKTVYVTFISRGEIVEVQKLETGDRAVEPKDPGYLWHDLEGWYLASGVRYDFNDPVLEDLVLYASWDLKYPLFGLPMLNTTDHVAYIIGFEDGLVRPNASMTRAEAATIFFRLLTDGTRRDYWSHSNPFVDVNSSDWFNTAVSTLYQAGVIVDSGSYFRPNAPITRAELAVMAAQFADYDTWYLSSFYDVDSTYWAAWEIAVVEQMGWIEGYPDGSFRPNASMTRAEVVTLVNRMLGRAVEDDHMLKGMVTFPDNRSYDWYYEEIQEAANSHGYVRTGVTVPGEDFQYEEWTSLHGNPDWAKIESEWYYLYG